MGSKRVAGANKGDIFIYTLSTCGWCKKTKALLDGLGVEYGYADLDQVSESEKEALAEEMKNWNPKLSFPTVVINKETCVIGYKEEDIKKALGL